MWLKKLWDDEAGVVDVSSYIFFVTVICLGTLCGWVTIRDQVVQELGDLSVGIEPVSAGGRGTIEVGELSAVIDRWSLVINHQSDLKSQISDSGSEVSGLKF
jgi:hypothetical protein